MQYGCPRICPKAASVRARQILEEYDIDWHKGLENLVFAPNRKHNDRNIIMLWEKLEELKKAGKSRQRIVDELQEVGKRFAKTGSYY